MPTPARPPLYEVATMGRQLKVGVTALGATGAPTTRLSCSQCTLTKTPTHLDVPYFRGQLAHRSEDVVEGTYTVGGALAMPFLHPEDATALLTLICGGATLSPITQDFEATVDRGVLVTQYKGLRVQQAVLSSQAGQPLSMQLQVEGTESASGSTFSLSFPTSRPFMHHDAVIIVDGTARMISNFQMTINNGLIADRFLNSQFRTELPQGDRQITVAFQTPFTSAEQDLYTLALAGVAGSIVYTTSGTSSRTLTLTFPCLQAPITDPVPPSPTAEIPLQMNMTARTLGTGTEEFTWAVT